MSLLFLFLLLLLKLLSLVLFGAFGVVGGGVGAGAAQRSASLLFRGPLVDIGSVVTGAILLAWRRGRSLP